MFPRATASVLIAAAAFGCGAADSDDEAGDQVNGGQTGEESARCVETSRRALALAADSPLGFSGSEVLGALGGEQRLPLTWQGQGGTTLRIAVAPVEGAVELVERQLTSGAPGSPEPEIAVFCGDVLEVGVSLTFVTDDGAFDELWPATLSADSASTAAILHAFDATELSGSFRVTGVDPAQLVSVSTYVSVNFISTAWSGVVEGQTERRSGSDPDSDVSSSHFPIATF